jgi:uncharacterized phage-associated protein
MSRLEELLLFILDRAEKEGKKDLSRFQLFKIPYLLQVYSLKYAGVPFIPDATFIREKNGPISISIYTALKNLEISGYIKKEITENREYGYPKHAFSLGKKITKFHFEEDEIIFLDNFLSELLMLTQAKLKEKAYATEPMLEIQEKEKHKGILKGNIINFTSVSVDPDIVDAYSDSDEL